MFDLSGIPIGWRDALDIALVAFLLYHAIRFVRGTRAMAALNGLFVLLLLYVAAQIIGMYSLVWLLEKLFGSLFLVIVVLFNQDIRQALSSMNLRSLFKRKAGTGHEELVRVLSETCVALAARRIGAIVVVEMEVPLGDMMERGVKVDALVSEDLLSTIFFPNTALHDGAVIVNRQSRVVAAGCVLPLAQVARQHFGTRHRAGLGISEVSDAIAIVVSEERGEVTVAQDGRLSNPLNLERLQRILTNALDN